MAVSLALNWTPPSSSPLLDEPQSNHHSRTSLDAVLTPPSSRNRQSSTPSPTGSSRAQDRTLHVSSTDHLTRPEQYTSSNVGRPTSSTVSPAHSRTDSPSFATNLPMFGSQFQPQPFGQSTPGYYMPSQQQQQQQQNQLAWMQYQQMLQAQAHQFYAQQQLQQQQHSAHSGIDLSQGDGRRRTSSTPQRPQPITYNDTFRRENPQSQAPFPSVPYPSGVFPPNQMRNSASQPSGLGQFGQISQPIHSSSASVPSSGAFHPYRRSQRSQDPGASSQPAALSASSAANHVVAQQSSQDSRARTSSANSTSSSHDTSPMVTAERNRGISPSPSAPSLTNNPATKLPLGGSTSQAGLGHLRGAPPRSNSQSSITSDAPSRASTVTGPAAHQRSNSNASITSVPAHRSNAAMAPAKKPSPLSRQTGKDDDREAVYGGSDDEERVNGGRSSPMFGYSTKSKKTGLSSKLRKALSFSSMNEIPPSETAPVASRPGTGRQLGGLANSSRETHASTGSTQSTSPPRTPDNGAALSGSSAASISSRRGAKPPLTGNNETKRSIFNRKMNSSSDNLSISSTVSSASVMLRKVGNLGKMARRHSLMGLTNMFNKEKDRDGKDGLSNASFTSLPLASDDTAINSSQNKKSLKSKKGTPASAAITHATVELENTRPAEAGMTPAASYVRQHQIQMQAQAELEKTAARERAEAEAKAREAGEHRQRMIEKEKERLKTKRGWRKKFGSTSSVNSIQPDGPKGLDSAQTDRESFDQGYLGGWKGGVEAEANAGIPQLHTSHGDDDFDTSFDKAFLERPHMPAAGGMGDGESGDEAETESLRHWGEGIERSRASAAQFRNYKGILKRTASNPDLLLKDGFERPFAGRIRANSYDAPQASSVHGAPTMTHVSNNTAGMARLDGIGAKTDPPTSSRMDGERSASPVSIQPGGSALGHHSNSSMPTLSMLMAEGTESEHGAQRSVTAPAQEKKRLAFADDDIFHSTWPATIYDRRGEQATCNRLTPLLAQRIKEELNTYKMEEMAVAPSSRIYTHFFV